MAVDSAGDMSAQAAAQALGVSRQRVMQLVKSGRLQGCKTDGVWRVSSASVHEFRPRPSGRPRRSDASVGISGARQEAWATPGATGGRPAGPPGLDDSDRAEVEVDGRMTPRVATWVHPRRGESELVSELVGLRSEVERLREVIRLQAESISLLARGSS